MTDGRLVVTMLAMTLAVNEARLAAQNLGGAAARRRRLTALSVDVVDSMSLCSSMSVEEWWTVIEQVFAIISEGVQRFGGWMENFAGDGGVAVFGVGEDPVDQADRACAAALWLRRATDVYAAEFKTRHGVELSGGSGSTPVTR
jgi:class 3 adenylate cyclase